MSSGNHRTFNSVYSTMSTFEEVDALQLLKLPIKVLNFVGYDFLNENFIVTSKKFFVRQIKKFYFFLICLNFFLVFICQLIDLTTLPTLKLLLHPLMNTLNTVVVMLKTFAVFHNRSTIVDILRQLKEPFIDRLDEFHESKVKKVVKTFQLFEKVQIIALSASTFSFIAQPVVAFMYTGQWYQFMPWDFWMPFNRFDERFYNFVLLWNDWMMCNAAFLFFATDNIIFGTVAAASIRFIVLNHDVRVTIDGAGDIFAIVNRHHQLISLVEQVNQIFSPCFLVNFIGSSMVMCLAAFISAKSEDIMTFVRFGSLLALLFGQIFILCRFGDLLESSSQELSTSIYNSDWYHRKNKKIAFGLKIMMRQAQKPCQLKAGKFAVLNSLTLMTVCNATYSYFMLLRSKIL
jgi:7tm Odorant receptor